MLTHDVFTSLDVLLDATSDELLEGLKKLTDDELDAAEWLGQDMHELAARIKEERNGNF
jgi:hypothetical protein